VSTRVPDIIQTDFGGGQINPSGKRRDALEFVKTGAKQMQNFRLEAIGTIVNRPAKRPVFGAPGSRTEYVRMQAGHEFMVNFGWSATGGGLLTIYNLDGTSFVQQSGYDWSPANINSLSFCVALFDIVICGPSVDVPGTNFRPTIARWSPADDTWTFLPYSFRNINAQSQEAFYRFSVPGATMTWQGQTGNVTLTCSVPYFTGNMVGELLSIVGQQVTIVQVIDSQHAIVSVAYRLPDTMWLAVQDARPFQKGMIAELRDQNLKIEIGAAGFAPSLGIPWFSNAVRGVMLSNLVCDFSQFVYAPYDPTTNPTGPDVLVSPIGSSAIAGYPFAFGNGGEPTVEWTEQFMCQQRGWPGRCAYTAGRLAFFSFPQMQEAILWSAVGSSDVCWVDPVAAQNQPEAGAQPDAAILEFEASRPAIINLVEWGDIFVFTDRGIFFIPVSQSTPLSPGNVEFRRFSNDGVSPINPVSTQDAIVYINTGLNRCSVVRATGSLTRPYVSDDVSESHAPLFTGPVSLAIATGDGLYPERHVYVVNADGTIVVGKFTQQRTLVGWVPWTSSAQTTWVTNAGPKVWFTSQYANALGTAYVVEIEDDTVYLDGVAFINGPSPGMVNGSLGPLWHFAGGTVTVCDSLGVTSSGPGVGPPVIDYGERQVDASGNIVFLPTDGAWSSSTTVYAGSWSPLIYEPFLFPPKEGAANPGARGKRRKLQRGIITVQHSNGFTFAKRQIPPLDWNEPVEQPEGLNNSTAWTQVDVR
jgi:hypothetical protein